MSARLLSRVASVLVLGTALSASAADLVLQKVSPLTLEQAPEYPQNVARIDLGAQVETTPATDAASLLSGDAKATYNLNAGVSTLLISLGKSEHVDFIGFLNSDAKGTVAIATATANLGAANSQWRDAAKVDLRNGPLSAKLGPSDAKYVRLTFNVTSAGHINELGVFTTPGVADFTVPRPRRAIEGEIAQVSYNVADLHTKTRALYVTSGNDLKSANNMLDEKPMTSYAFAADDNSPAVVVDLGREMALRRVSVLANAGEGSATFYLLNALPADANNAGTLRIDDSALASFKTLGTASDDGNGRAAVDFPETSGRYLLVKWNRPAGTPNLSVAEIAAFGRPSGNMLFAANQVVDRSKEDAKDAKDAKDVKDIPAEGPEAQPPAEGPAPGLPAQPPFVFIPQVVPTSP